MTKYALFKYRNSNNVGDEIQSIAARRFLPTVDYYIDRDEVGEWENRDQNETVKLIANGWYMHSPYAWPIIDKTISPLLVSMHINEHDERVVEQFSSRKNREYMNSFGLVGARDNTTRKFFSKVGIKSYFSACLTLTLQRDKRIKKQDYILAVSVSDASYRAIKKSTRKRVIRFNPYIDRGLDNTETIKLAEYILFMYQSASYVVTTKVHAMLPSLALETPVLFVDEDESYDPSRFDGLLELVNTVKKEDLVSGNHEYDFDNPRSNPDVYKKYREELILRGENFTGYKDNKSFIRMIDVSKIDQPSIASRIPMTDDELSTSELLNDLKPPAFSIVMPAYNIKGYLTEAVISIKNQSFTDFECIIVDDGSTDKGTEPIAEIIRDDKRFKIVIQENGGLANARNNGYALTKGEYVLFLDGDDIFLDTLLESVNDKIMDSGADVVIFNHSVLDNATGHVSGGIHRLAQLAQKRSFTPQSMSDDLFNVFGNQVWTKAFNRDFIENHKLRFNENLKRAEDIPYTYSALLRAKKLTVIDKPLVEYRVNRGSSNSDLLAAHHKDIFQALAILHTTIKEQPAPDNYSYSFSRLFLENVYYNLHALVGSGSFNKEFKLAKEYQKKFHIKITKDQKKVSDLAEIDDIIRHKDSVDMLVYMLNRERKDLARNQTTIYHLNSHLAQLKQTIVEQEDKIAYIGRQYSNLKQRYDQLLRIPRLLKRRARRVKRIILGEK